MLRNQFEEISKIERQYMTKNIVVISGAAGGIGGALCRKYLEQGLIVAALDLDEDAMERLKKLLFDDMGAKIIPVIRDLTDGSAIREGV